MATKFTTFFLSVVVVVTLLRSSMAQTTHVVGDAIGWVVPPNGAATYSNWAANKAFAVGDILVFSFVSGAHDVAQVTKTSFDACNTTNPILVRTNGPANITLNSAGEHYYICRFPGHCSAGQKLLVNVSNAASSPAPQPSSPAPQPSSPSPVSAPSPSSVPTPTPAPKSAPTPAPKSAPTPAQTSAPTPTPTRQPSTYVVGDAIGWTIPPNASAYQIWARNKNFMVQDTLVFNYVNGTHDVAEVSKGHYDSCNTTNPISLLKSPPTRITLRSAGEHYYICAFPNHCSSGQKLAINVTGSSSPAPTPSPSSTVTPPPSTATPTTPTATPPSGVTAPPPPNSSAKSLDIAGLFTTFFAIVVALLY